jgi:LDH2 family malate/lactate/ureidoglycolate dehydrogenase
LLPRHSAPHLHRVISSIYMACGVPEAEARTVARHQVEANLAGHDSHGVIQTLPYVESIRKGHIVPGAAIDLEQTGPSTWNVDGNWGWGFVVTENVLGTLMDAARREGLAAACIRRQGHVGRLGAYTMMAAEAGFIALMTADSGAGPKSAAPYGGRDRRLGTNPISIALPSNTPSPIVLDMATTTVAGGKLDIAISRGEKIPASWIVDAGGRATTDPHDYHAGGALLPLGGDQGHKGYALSFVVEALSGILTGLGFGVDEEARHNDGVFIALWDVSRFRPLDEFRAEMAAFASFVKTSRPAKGFKEVLYPGELEHRTTAERRRLGVPIEASTWQSIRDLAVELEVDMTADETKPAI